MTCNRVRYHKDEDVCFAGFREKASFLFKWNAVKNAGFKKNK